MCGIAGVVGRPDREAVGRMIDAMARRGPDDSGIYADADVALGHRRLSVIDLSPSGHQPMTRAGGLLVLTYNGEIYNFQSLRTSLEARGQRFVSRSDTEVILALYESEGVEGFARLRGMFAFALLDRRAATPRVVLVRDHFGIKPLLYAEAGGRLVFASDLPGLLASGLVPGTVDPVALVQYLMQGHVAQPRTLVRGVRMLPPGHVMTMTPGERPAVRRYWALDAARSARLTGGLDFEQQAAQVRTLLEAAAAAQMVSDVPLGAFLSGGVDSTTLVALMTRAAGRPIHTYSVGFAGAGATLDESADAERSARALGSVHTAVTVTGADLALQLPAIAADLGQPTVDGVNMHLVSRAARRGVTVALSGLGGDELFAGYPTFEGLAGIDRPARRLRAMLGRLRRGVARGAPPVTRSWRALQRRMPFAATYLTYHLIRTPEAAWRLAGEPAIDPEELFEHLDADADPPAGLVPRVSRLETSLYMGSQLLRDADAASMAHSLEVRVPLLDVELAEFAYGLPDASQIGAPRAGARPGGKRAFVRAVDDLIPEWTWKKPKRGFTLPFGEWMRGPIAPLIDETFAAGSLEHLGLLDADQARREWDRFRRDGEGSWTGAWSVLMFALWARARAGVPARRDAGIPTRG